MKELLIKLFFLIVSFLLTVWWWVLIMRHTQEDSQLLVGLCIFAIIGWIDLLNTLNK